MDPDHEHKDVDLDPVQNFPERKKKQRRGGKKKQRRGVTGFEEYYADPPTTPEEALREQRELYASSIPFEQRIQTCIHRYRTRRRLSSELDVYFSEYMFLGGINTTGTAFSAEELEDGSLIPHATEATTREQDDEAASTRLYDGNARNWTVDFAGVVAGFLSISILPLTCLEPAPTERAIGVVENFLRYVLQHDVCPEHADDVKAALGMCARARDEWPRLCRFQSLLPGRFNLAAAQTFEVHDEADWSLQSRKDAETLSPELIFYASLVAAGQPVPKTETGRSDLRLSRQFVCSLALQSIEMPTDDITSCFRRLALGSEAHKTLNLQPLGRAVFRPTVIEDGWVRQVLAQTPLSEDEDVVFFFERELLAAMTVGMMVTAQVCELSSGFRFVKTLEQVQPSFYTFLPQHLIKDYKPPRPNDRPPPSVHDRAAAATAEEPEEEEEPAEE
ncbi:Argonaute complex, subunit Arb1 [Akanthomyces lecanii RCEF 1005]|uniref:Argonaute complex, subunit Arb1 n=1 Tax=Akanthomyces lecanii RCEF 1005 TaxID=1081108 RepID=A0A168GKU3_CORDF|nr:Argonaute complex, subunit Arb1 [Akanthomyces lecanii RCEF 1005]